MALKWMSDVGGKVQYLNWDKFNGLVYLKIRFRIFLADESFTFPLVSPPMSNYCSIRSYPPVSCIVFSEKLIIVLNLLVVGTWKLVYSSISFDIIRYVQPPFVRPPLRGQSAWIIVSARSSFKDLLSASAACPEEVPGCTFCRIVLDPEAELHPAPCTSQRTYTAPAYRLPPSLHPFLSIPAAAFPFFPASCLLHLLSFSVVPQPPPALSGSVIAIVDLPRCPNGGRAR